MAFSYLPQNDDELELKVGDIIEVVGEVSELLGGPVASCVWSELPACLCCPGALTAHVQALWP